jgi:hypothetical protein
MELMKEKEGRSQFVRSLPSFDIKEVATFKFQILIIRKHFDKEVVVVG